MQDFGFHGVLGLYGRLVTKFGAQLVRIGNQLLGPERQLQWEMTFQLKFQQPDMPEV